MKDEKEGLIWKIGEERISHDLGEVDRGKMELNPDANELSLVTFKLCLMNDNVRR